MGRKAGSLMRATCKLCGAVEVVTGCGSNWRCSGCRRAGRYFEGHGTRASLGRDRASLAVARAIREGKLPHPSGLQCVDCAADAMEYEHRDYNKPLVVVPICRSCNLRRGPAIPLEGTIRQIVSTGSAPYRRRADVEKLFRTMGHSTEALQGLPARLTADHWRTLLPFFPA